MRHDYDLVVIGGGAAGLTASQVVAATGKRVALVESSRPGGECLYTGCVPSKAVLSLAKRIHEARKVDRLGFELSGKPVWSQVKTYLSQAISQLAIVDSPDALAHVGVEVIAGRAAFVAPHTVQVSDANRTFSLTGRRYILATGSKAHFPSIPGLKDVSYLTHETLFDLMDLPSHLIIVGGGAMGCEMAQAFWRLGSEVTLIQNQERLLPQAEPELSQALLQALREEGIQVLLDTQIQQVSGSIEVRLNAGTIQGSHLLIAAGKRPRLEGLGLERIGAAYSDRGLEVNRLMRSTTCGYLYGAGDVTGGPMFTHWATEQATLAALGSMGLWGTGLAYLRRRSAALEIPSVVFTDPEIAQWGLTEIAARKKYGTKVVVIDFDYAQLDRAVTEDSKGLVKLVALRGWFDSPVGLKIVGAHVVGERAGEIIHLLSLPSRLGFMPLKLALLPHAYPTFAEATRLSLMGLFAQGHAFGKKR